MYTHCPECNARITREDASYCSNCGKSVEVNKCSNIDCPHNFENSLAKDDCYCYECGSKSTYLTLGIIQSEEFKF